MHTGFIGPNDGNKVDNRNCGPQNPKKTSYIRLKHTVKLKGTAKSGDNSQWVCHSGHFTHGHLIHCECKDFDLRHVVIYYFTGQILSPGT